MKNHPRFTLSVIIAMLSSGIAFGLACFQRTRDQSLSHIPPTDTCVAVELRDKFPARSISTSDGDLNVLYGYIYSINSTWIKIGKKSVYRNEYAWVPVSNVAAILDSDKCDDKK